LLPPAPESFSFSLSTFSFSFSIFLAFFSLASRFSSFILQKDEARFLTILFFVTGGEAEQERQFLSEQEEYYL
jgi:hypothetical protein